MTSKKKITRITAIFLCVIFMLLAAPVRVNAVATLNLSGGTGQFTWSVSGLSSQWNTNNYSAVVLSTNTTIVPPSPAPTGAFSSIPAPSSGTSYSTSTQTVSYAVGTHTFYAYTVHVQDTNGERYMNERKVLQKRVLQKSEKNDKISSKNKGDIKSNESENIQGKTIYK